MGGVCGNVVGLMRFGRGLWEWGGACEVVGGPCGKRVDLVILYLEPDLSYWGRACAIGVGACEIVAVLCRSWSICQRVLSGLYGGDR